jgi:hypothetical protein
MIELREHKAEVLVALAGHTAGASSGSAVLLRRAHLAVVPDLSDPDDIHTWLLERAAMREDSGAARVDADQAAFDQLLWIWHAANPVERAPGQCAACGTPFKPLVMALAVRGVAGKKTLAHTVRATVLNCLASIALLVL